MDLLTILFFPGAFSHITLLALLPSNPSLPSVFSLYSENGCPRIKPLPLHSNRGHPEGIQDRAGARHLLQKKPEWPVQWTGQLTGSQPPSRHDRSFILNKDKCSWAICLMHSGKVQGKRGWHPALGPGRSLIEGPEFPQGRWGSGHAIVEAAVQIQRGLLSFPSPEEQEVGALTQSGKRAPGEGCLAT